MLPPSGRYRNSVLRALLKLIGSTLKSALASYRKQLRHSLIHRFPWKSSFLHFFLESSDLPRVFKLNGSGRNPANQSRARNLSFLDIGHFRNRFLFVFTQHLNSSPRLNLVHVSTDGASPGISCRKFVFPGPLRDYQLLTVVADCQLCPKSSCTGWRHLFKLFYIKT